MRKPIDSLELFFARFVPSPLKRIYFLGFRYGVFIVGGGIGYVLYVLTELSLLKAGVPLAISLATGLVLAVLFTFTYHRYVTFEQRGGWKEKLLKFAPSQAVIATISGVLAYIAIKHYHFPNVPSTFVITLAMSIVNFAANKLFIFKKQA